MGMTEEHDAYRNTHQSISSSYYIYRCILMLLSLSRRPTSSQVMAIDNCNISSICKRFKPHMLMVLTQMGYTLLYFITEASFNHGMNPHVYITYRHIVGGLVMFPFAYFLERYSMFPYGLFMLPNLLYVFLHVNALKQMFNHKNSDILNSKPHNANIKSRKIYGI